MTRYFLECYWPGVNAEQIAAALARFGDGPVRPLDTILVPADEIVLCVVEGDSDRQIRDAAYRAGLPSERVVECVHLVSHAPSRGNRQEGGKA
jgi:hypothetical protein